MFVYSEGFLNGHINALLAQARKYHFTDDLHDFMGLLEHADYKLLTIMQNECYCLNNFLPPIKTAPRKLRAQGHKFPFQENIPEET